MLLSPNQRIHSSKRTTKHLSERLWHSRNRHDPLTRYNLLFREHFKHSNSQSTLDIFCHRGSIYSLGRGLSISIILGPLCSAVGEIRRLERVFERKRPQDTVVFLMVVVHELGVTFDLVDRTGFVFIGNKK